MKTAGAHETNMWLLFFFFFGETNVWLQQKTIKRERENIATNKELKFT